MPDHRGGRWQPLGGRPEGARAATCGLVLLAAVMALFPPKMRPAAAQGTADFGAIDRFITSEMDGQRIPGLALAITHGDRVLYVKGYGTAGGRPVTSQTQFLIGSLSKSFTALAVMQLVEQGRIDLDAPVRTYVPELALADPTAATGITIRQLLNQTSGLADAGFPEMRLPQPTTIEERVASLSAARPVAPPGAEYHYFNPNYQVLAAVIEAASGQPLSEYLAERVFAPLRMDDSFGATTSAEAFRRGAALAQGHVVAFGATLAYPEMQGFLAGSGGVVSTAEDMAHFLLVQSSGGRFEQSSLLSAEGVRLMHTPPPGVDSPYAMGWLTSTVGGARALEHSGVLATFYGEALLLPDEGYGVALLYNVHSTASDLLAFPRIKEGVVALLQGEAPPSGGLSVAAWGLIMAMVTLVGVLIGLRSLQRLPRWARRAGDAPRWHAVPGIIWRFVPLVALLGLPAFVLATSDRAFSYGNLLQAMPDIMIWLSFCAALGVVDGTARIAILTRRGGRPRW